MERNNYTYNSKEHHNEFDLGWVDYGARYYDPQVGRWWSVDPLADKFASYSPYNYVLNNPFKYMDPDGRDIVLLGSNNSSVTIILKFGQTPPPR